MEKVWKPVLGKSRIGFQTSSLACEHNPWHRIVTTREGGLGLPVLFTPILKMTFPRPRLTCLGSPQLLKGRVPISRPTFFLSCLLSFTFQSPVKPEPEYKSELRLWLAGCPQGRHKFSKHSSFASRTEGVVSNLQSCYGNRIRDARKVPGRTPASQRISANVSSLACTLSPW